MNFDFDAVWERVCYATKWRKQGELANFLDIKPQTVSGARRRGSFPIEWAYRIAQKFRFSTDWLLSGKGHVYRVDSKADVATKLIEEGKLPPSFEVEEEGVQEVSHRYSWRSDPKDLFGSHYADLIIGGFVIGKAKEIIEEKGLDITIDDNSEDFFLMIYNVLRKGTKEELLLFERIIHEWLLERTPE